MDPTACLDEIRSLLLQRRDDRVHALPPDDADRLCELVDALDGWVSRGGFLPTQWKKAGR